jgi:triphosphoribosyl-dephospho-CoA synthetase
MFNSAGLLKNLRKLGFRTFHGDIINESYDDEPNDQKRFTMAWHEIRKLYHTDARHIYPEFRKVLEHNHQLIQSWTSDEFNNIKNFLHRSLL